jgi:hypothetical protein
VAKAESEDTVMAETPAVLVPIGHGRGPFHPEPGKAPEVYTVRIGWGIATLNAEEYTVWSIAHGTLPETAEEPWTREKVQSLAVDEAEIADPAPIVDRLLEMGLLQEVRADGEAGRSFAESHRLLPLMVGLGNDDEQPWIFKIGLPNLPVVGVPDSLYELWSRAHLEDTLWTGCRVLADINREAGATDDEDIDPAMILGACLTSLHSLLAASGAYVDVTMERRAE